MGLLMFGWIEEKLATRRAQKRRRERPSVDEVLRYPPPQTGVPMLDVSDLIDSQHGLIQRITYTSGIDAATVNPLLMPVIERFASYVHLLPASNRHHHRGVGGLFHHSLEVAFLAGQSSNGKVFGFGKTPLERKHEEPRWRVAAILTGLLHDIGKPVSDMRVTSAKGHTWNPFIEPLTQWAERFDVERYYLYWERNGKARHEQIATTILPEILTPQIKAWLVDRNTEVISAMLSAISASDSDGLLYQIMNRADSASVQRDLENNAALPEQSAVSAPLERHIVDAMRDLYEQGVWSVNTAGARLWYGEEGVFIAWKAAAEEIVYHLERQGVPGIPRNAITLADMLIDRGIAESMKAGDDDARRYWPIAPDAINQGRKKQILIALRLKNPDILFDMSPPPKAGVNVQQVEYDEIARTLPGEGRESAPSAPPAVANDEARVEAGDAHDEASSATEVDQAAKPPSGEGPPRSQPPVPEEDEPAPATAALTPAQQQRVADSLGLPSPETIQLPETERGEMAAAIPTLAEGDDPSEKSSEIEVTDRSDPPEPARSETEGVASSPPAGASADDRCQRARDELRTAAGEQAHFLESLFDTADANEATIEALLQRQGRSLSIPYPQGLEALGKPSAIARALDAAGVLFHAKKASAKNPHIHHGEDQSMRLVIAYDALEAVQAALRIDATGGDARPETPGQAQQTDAEPADAATIPESEPAAPVDAEPEAGTAATLGGGAEETPEAVAHRLRELLRDPSSQVSTQLPTLERSPGVVRFNSMFLPVTQGLLKTDRKTLMDAIERAEFITQPDNHRVVVRLEDE
jgi:hypothetical protein